MTKIAKPDSSILPTEAEVPYAQPLLSARQAFSESNETKVLPRMPDEASPISVGIGGSGDKEITLTLTQDGIRLVKVLDAKLAIRIANRLISEALSTFPL